MEKYKDSGLPIAHKKPPQLVLNYCFPKLYRQFQRIYNT